MNAKYKKYYPKDVRQSGLIETLESLKGTALIKVVDIKNGDINNIRMIFINGDGLDFEALNRKVLIDRLIAVDILCLCRIDNSEKVLFSFSDNFSAEFSDKISAKLLGHEINDVKIDAETFDFVIYFDNSCRLKLFGLPYNTDERNYVLMTSENIFHVNNYNIIVEDKGFEITFDS